MKVRAQRGVERALEWQEGEWHEARFSKHRTSCSWKEHSDD
jgi:hypothetical protein